MFVRVHGPCAAAVRIFAIRGKVGKHFQLLLFEGSWCFFEGRRGGGRTDSEANSQTTGAARFSSCVPEFWSN